MGVSLEDRQALESFIVSSDLVELESRFSQFNAFEALGVARREIHHSSFLAFLLSPSESHCLRDLFLRRFLQEVTRWAPEPSISAIELDGIDLTYVDVKREYENVDIYIRDTTNKIVVVIENKVGSKQHDDQLKRYVEVASRLDPEYRFLGIYLTPGGEDPKHNSYFPFSYEQVRKLADELLQRDNVLLPLAFRSTLEQYSQLLRRRFMADQELEELCSKIYKRHRQAIDILLKNLPNKFGIALEAIRDLAVKDGMKVLEHDVNAVRFIPKAFDISAFRSETAHLKSGQMVYLECCRKREDLFFQCKMDGGSAEERAKVYQFASIHQPPFKVEKTLYNRFQILYSKMLLGSSGDTEMSDESLSIFLTGKWKDFMQTTVAAMSRACVDLSSNQAE